MRAMVKYLPLLYLVFLSACHKSTSSSTTVPWSTLVWAEDQTYVLGGTQTNTTKEGVSLSHGGPATFVVPTQRDFSLCPQKQPSTAIGTFSEKIEGGEAATYAYFTKIKTLVACYDSFSPRIANLSQKTEFRCRGLLCNSRQAHTRYALTHDSDSNQFWMYDKVTGAENQLSSAAVQFIGDTLHVQLLVIGDGDAIAKVNEDYAAKQLMVSTWDLKKGNPGPQSPPIPFGAFDEPSVRFATIWKDSLVFVYGGPIGDYSGGQSLTAARIENDQLTEIPIYRSEKTADGGRLDVVSSQEFRVEIVHHLVEGTKASKRWIITDVDLTTGAIIETKDIQLP